MKNDYDAKDAWLNLYQNGNDISYPAEGVIRIFKGSFPNLKMKKNYEDAKILDVGYGDGRHFSLFNSLGMDCYGVEIDEKINEKIRANLKKINISAKLHVGSAADLPFESSYFDYVMAWNSCYYMSLTQLKFEDHVSEMLRVLRTNGYFIVSVPSHTSFVFDNAKNLDGGYAVIQNDFFGARNGEVMRRFRDKDDLISSFSYGLADISVSEIKMDWFGLNYHWLVLVGKKR